MLLWQAPIFKNGVVRLRLTFAPAKLTHFILHTSHFNRQCKLLLIFL